MKRLALKVDVESLRGTLLGVPRLLDALRRHSAQASFFFSLGPDRTGRTIGRLFQPTTAVRIAGTSALEHHGWMAMFYGTLLPGPDIGRRCAAVLRSVRDTGFETGLHGWDPVGWQEQVEQADARWTLREMERAIARHRELFGEAPKMHGAPGWRMNPHALRLTQRLGFDFCSDCRGTHPFIPVQNGEIVLCPQLPTTLPTLDELMGRDGLGADNVHEHLLGLTAEPPPQGHVYTLRAEVEGGRWLPTFERLLEGWQHQGYELVSLRGLYDSLDAGRLPRHRLLHSEVPGRGGGLMVQGAEFLGVTQ